MKDVAYKEAKANGEKYYFNGWPCRRGYIAKRLTSQRTCVECAALWYAEEYKRWEVQRRSENRRDQKVRKTALAEGQTEYFTGRPCTNGHFAYRKTNSAQCVACVKMRDSQKPRNPREQSKGSVLREQALADGQKHYFSGDPCIRGHRAVRWASTGACLECHRERQKIQHGITARGRIKRAMPPWANIDAIKNIYANRPEGHHVDHIIPIKHKQVCGLHVETNLQYLPAIENIRKQNRFTPLITRGAL